MVPPVASLGFQDLNKVIFYFKGSKMTIREYQAQDFDSLIALYKNKEAYGGNFDDERDEPDKLLSTSRAGNLFVAEDKPGDIVGSCMILDNPHSFWLIRFAVAPETKGHDQIVELLVKKMESIAEQRGHESIIVYADLDNIDLNERYAHAGFITAGRYLCNWKKIGDIH